MCGITGFFDRSGNSNLEILRKMTGSIHHRGPDDSGEELFTTGEVTIGLGFRRLAIIDLSEAGHQPMFSGDRRCCIVFNGEIYNFKEIRKDLEALGHSFKSSSDTEVILASYLQWGIACIRKFIGMFAIVLYDMEKGKIFIVRDRAGIKPLYYFQNEKLFLFSSELKSFHNHPGFEKQLNKAAIPEYFRFGYIPSPLTIFKNTSKLLSGHYLTYDIKTGDTLIEKYWDVYDYFSKPKLKIGFEEAMAETEKLLVSAFGYRLISDVPVGVFLSGGYDSTCVAALLQSRSGTKRINTYTIGFDNKEYNEAGYAKEVAAYIGTEHHEYICKETDAIEIIPLLPKIYDEPFGDQSAIPTTLVCREARKHVTVALSADAGDELFAGYPRHLKSMKLIKKLSSLPDFLGKATASIFPFQGRFNKPDRYGKLKDLYAAKSIAEKFESINQSYTSREISALLQSHPIELLKPDIINSGSNLSDVLSFEYKYYLSDDILHKVDRASMSVSLEGREPFLDHRIVELVATLPDEFKLKDGKQKVLLKELVHKYVPEEMVNRPKMGFGIPLEKWFRTSLKNMFIETLDISKIKRQGVFNPEIVKRMVDSYIEGKFENFQRLWLIFVFQQWYDYWMND